MTSNVKDIKQQVDDIVKFCAIEELLELKESNLELYKYRIETRFYDFKEKYPTILKKIVNGDDLKYLDKMLTALDKINKDEVSKKDAEAVLGEELAKEYIYPLVNKHNKK